METILSIAGKPGLYKLVSRGKQNLIVEAIDASHRRQPAFASDRVTSLGDIAMYTDAEDIPLWEVLTKVGEIKKLLQWYNILVENGYTDFKATFAPEEEKEEEK